MGTSTETQTEERALETLAAVGIGAVLLALASWAAASAGVLSVRFAVGVFCVYAPAAVLVVRFAGDRFGWPNRVTLARLVLTALFGGLVLEGGVADDLAWAFVAVAAVALALDGVDGFLARKLDMASAFGARFDMEVDALLILLLSVLAWMLGKAGPWVLLIGLLRYAFVAAGWLWPPLTRPLPSSMRRKAVCVVQGAALGALLAPVVAPPLSGVLAFVALLLIVYSFAVDVIWLIRNRA